MDLFDILLWFCWFFILGNIIDLIICVFLDDCLFCCFWDVFGGVFFFSLCIFYGRKFYIWYVFNWLVRIIKVIKRCLIVWIFIDCVEVFFSDVINYG